MTTPALPHPAPAAPPPARRVRLDQVLSAVAAYYHTTEAALLGKRRSRSVAHPRQVCMYLARRLTRLSLAGVGDRLGGRDHTTVLHGAREVARRIGADPAFATQVRQIEGLVVGESGGQEP